MTTVTGGLLEGIMLTAAGGDGVEMSTLTTTGGGDEVAPDEAMEALDRGEEIEEDIELLLLLLLLLLDAISCMTLVEGEAGITELTGFRGEFRGGFGGFGGFGVVIDDLASCAFEDWTMCEVGVTGATDTTGATRGLSSNMSVV